MELTKEEKNAIATLKRLEKRWPKSLWLFSAAGTLHVMRAGENGEMMLGDPYGAISNSSGVDPDYCITTIKIENDGGDW